MIVRSILQCRSKRPRRLAAAANRCTVWLVLLLLMEEGRLLEEQQCVQQADKMLVFDRHARPEIAGCECRHMQDADFVSRSVSFGPEQSAV